MEKSSESCCIYVLGEGKRFDSECLFKYLTRFQSGRTNEHDEMCPGEKLNTFCFDWPPSPNTSPAFTSLYYYYYV